MPCDQVRQVTLELKDADMDVLKSAIESLGFKVRQAGENLYWNNFSYNRTTGEFTAANESQGQRIKSVYSDKLVDKEVQKLSRFGSRWSVKKLTSKDGLVQYKLFERP